MRFFPSFGEGLLHARKDLVDAEELILARKKFFAAIIEEAHDGEVPGRFFVFFEQLGFVAGLVVANEKGDEVCFDGFDEERMAEDFGPEVFASASSRDLLEEEEDWFA